MAKSENTFDDKALTDLVKASPELAAEMRRQGRAVANRANATLERRQPYPDYDVTVEQGENGPLARVWTRSNHAKNSNAIHQTLAKILG